MKEFHRILSLVLIMTTVAAIAVATTLYFLYQTALNEQRARLMETVQSQARLIEAVARFDAAYSQDYPNGVKEATLSQIVDAHGNYTGFGETGEFTLAERRGDQIVFLLNHRHFDMSCPRPIPFDSELAEPMRRALTGLSGTVVGLDYRGEKVLAAHEPVKELHLGIVAKIDLEEVKAPFVRAAVVAGFCTILVVLIGSGLFFYISTPMIRRLRESEAQYRGIFNAASDAFIVHDLVGNVIEANPQACDMHGYAYEEMIKLHAKDLVHSDSHQLFKHYLRDVKAKGEFRAEGVDVRKDGTQFPIEVAGSAFEYKGEEHLLATIKDVTERKEAEEKIEHLNRVLLAIRNVNQLITKEKDVKKMTQGACSNLVENRGYQSAWIALLDGDGRLLTTAEAGLGSNFLPLLERLKRGEFPECCQRALSGSNVVVIEDRLSICRDCPLAEKYEDMGAMALQLEHAGKCYGLISVSSPVEFARESAEQDLFSEVAGDISFALYSLEQEEERKRAEDALRESEKRLLATFEQGPVGMALTTIDYRWLIVNQALCDIAGYHQEEMMKQTFKDITHADDLPVELEHLGRLLAGEARSYSMEKRFIRKDGSQVWVTLTAGLIRDSSGEPQYFVAFMEDISQRKRAEEALKESEEKYRVLFESSKDGIVSADLQGHILEANQAYLDVLGYTLEEVKQLTYQQLTPPKWHEMDADIAKNQIIAKGYTDEYEKEYMKKDGTVIPVVLKTWLSSEAQGRSTRMWSVVRDITESRKAQMQLIEAEKLGALGTLTAGIAHELNNPLMGMINFIQYCIEKSPSDSKIHEVLKDAEHETKRCIEIVGNLLTFSRIEKQEDEKYERIDLKVIFDRILKLLAYRVEKEGVNVTRHTEKGVPEVWIKTNNMQQVFLNLTGNALDALKESKRKELHIDIRPHTEFVQVKIKDAGPGISSENLLRIFDPFFTTKPTGKGTGLGLSVSKGIVEDHGGTMLCESKLGVGTTFKVLLPLKRNEDGMDTNCLSPSEGKASRKKQKGAEKLRKGEETILLVDDEAFVIRAAQANLVSLGYQVLTAESGEDALRIYEANKDRIDLVILDMIMPGMGGGETYDRLKEVNPEVRVLLTSGYIINGQAQEILDRGCNGFIQKPFDAGVLSEKVREILDT